MRTTLSAALTLLVAVSAASSAQARGTINVGRQKFNLEEAKRNFRYVALKNGIPNVPANIRFELATVGNDSFQLCGYGPTVNYCYTFKASAYFDGRGQITSRMDSVHPGAVNLQAPFDQAEMERVFRRVARSEGVAKLPKELRFEVREFQPNNFEVHAYGPTKNYSFTFMASAFFDRQGQIVTPMQIGPREPRGNGGGARRDTYDWMGVPGGGARRDTYDWMGF